MSHAILMCPTSNHCKSPRQLHPTTGMAQSVPPIDIATQQNAYDDKHTYHNKVINSSARRIGYGCVFVMTHHVECSTPRRLCFGRRTMKFGLVLVNSLIFGLWEHSEIFGPKFQSDRGFHRIFLLFLLYF
uniref:Uncharacterized protein n=1 Tax=Caenorhabditis japonica TaxID=281687 RepID=A0A8R1EL99_CAEJA